MPTMQASKDAEAEREVMKMIWIGMIVIVFGVGYAILARNKTVHPVATDKNEITADPEGSVIPIQHDRLADVPEGVQVKGSVFFTYDGHAFLWPGQDVGGSSKVWHSGGKWYAKLGMGGVSRDLITGYQSISIAGGVPVTLVE